MKTDPYQKITDQIIAELEQGIRPWVKPWDSGHGERRIMRPLRANGAPYNGINVLVLWAAAVEYGYASTIWMTYRQASELNANVRKGERGSLVVYADQMIRKETDGTTGEEIERAIPFLKSYTVFNVEQIEGLPKHFYSKPETAKPIAERIPEIEAFFCGTGAKVLHGGNLACYVPSRDLIRLPCFEFFHSADAYYATRAHETIHWTRAEARLNREFGRKRFGDEGYAMEELVAELGAAFLSADLDLAPAIRDDHAPYIASWLKVLKNDKRAVFTAASHAQRAADYLQRRQPIGEGG